MREKKKKKLQPLGRDFFFKWHNIQEKGGM